MQGGWGRVEVLAGAGWVGFRVVGVGGFSSQARDGQGGWGGAMGLPPALV